MKSLTEFLEEKQEDVGRDMEEKILSDNSWDDIHPKITSVARSRYESLHYADAVEAAFKEVNNCVKEIVRRKTSRELDGAALMRAAFSPSNPLIVLDDLSTQSGRNIQEGYMVIFAGAMISIRNHKAHYNLDVKDKRAKHLIYLASLLMNKIDERI